MFASFFRLTEIHRRTYDFSERRRFQQLPRTTISDEPKVLGERFAYSTQQMKIKTKILNIVLFAVWSRNDLFEDRLPYPCKGQWVIQSVLRCTVSNAMYLHRTLCQTIHDHTDDGAFKMHPRMHPYTPRQNDPKTHPTNGSENGSKN